MDIIFIPAAMIVLAIETETGIVYISATVATGELGEYPTMEQIDDAIGDVIEEYAQVYEVGSEHITMMTMEDAIAAGAVFGE